MAPGSNPSCDDLESNPESYYEGDIEWINFFGNRDAQREGEYMPSDPDSDFDDVITMAPLSDITEEEGDSWHLMQRQQTQNLCDKLKGQSFVAPV